MTHYDPDVGSSVRQLPPALGKRGSGCDRRHAHPTHTESPFRALCGRYAVVLEQDRQPPRPLFFFFPLMFPLHRRFTPFGIGV